MKNQHRSRQLRRLSPGEQNLLSAAIAALEIKHGLKSIPLVVRYLLAHAGIFLWVVRYYPVSVETPPLIMTVLWAGSLAITITGISLGKLLKN